MTSSFDVRPQQFIISFLIVCYIDTAIFEDLTDIVDTLPWSSEVNLFGDSIFVCYLYSF